MFFEQVLHKVAGDRFVEYRVIPQRTWWCCKSLKEHDKGYALWNIKWGKFYFKDISPDGSMAFFPMYYCPYCGEKIEYVEFTKKGDDA